MTGYFDRLLAHADGRRHCALPVLPPRFGFAPAAISVPEPPFATPAPVHAADAIQPTGPPTATETTPRPPAIGTDGRVPPAAINRPAPAGISLPDDFAPRGAATGAARASVPPLAAPRDAERLQVSPAASPVPATMAAPPAGAATLPAQRTRAIAMSAPALSLAARPGVAVAPTEPDVAINIGRVEVLVASPGQTGSQVARLPDRRLDDRADDRALPSLADYLRHKAAL